jgi:hypothetical protein
MLTFQRGRFTKRKGFYMLRHRIGDDFTVFIDITLLLRKQYNFKCVLLQKSTNMFIFVAGLPYDLDDAELEEIFEKFGTVKSAKVTLDKETGKSRGFGFVEMPDSTEANDAIENLNDISLGKKPLVVKAAEDRGGPSGGGNRGPSSGGSGGGYRSPGGGGGFNRDRDSRGGSGGGYNKDRKRY